MRRRSYGTYNGICKYIGISGLPPLRDQPLRVQPLKGRTLRDQNEAFALMPEVTRMVNSYISSVFSSVHYHYAAVATVCLVVLLSYMLPNLSHKIHRNTELKAMKKVLSDIAKEVSRAELACYSVADQADCLQCSKHDDSTETTTNNQDLAMCTSDSVRSTRSAPVQVPKKMDFFRRIFFPHRNTSHKEIAIMSYLYTDSFDGSREKKEAPIQAEPNLKV